MANDSHQIQSVEELRNLFGPVRQAQQTKAITRFDEHCRRWIAASPFIVVGSADASGRMDLSPKGDPAGFVQVVDDTTLAIPDRRGNNRVDTFTNVLANPRVSVLFVVPGRGETLRVEGTATITTDPDVLEPMAVNGQSPVVALVVSLTEVMFHCGKSMIRSKLWEAEHWPSVEGLASYAECLAAQASPDETVGEMEARFGTWSKGAELY